MNYFRYSIKIWVTSLFLSPTVLFLIEEGGEAFSSPSQGLGMVLLFVLFGGMFSIPNWLLLTFGVWCANRLDWSVSARRLLTQLWATVLTFGLFLWLFGKGAILPGELFQDPMPLVYWLTITFGIWTYDFPTNK